MNTRIRYSLTVFIALFFTYSGFSQISPAGKQEAQKLVYNFGQLFDLSSAKRGNQTKPEDPTMADAEKFISLFRPAIITDSMERVKDSLIILNFLDPNLQILKCYSGRNISRQSIDTCMMKKAELGRPYRLGVHQFVDTVMAYFTQTYSNIEQNQIFFEDAYHQKIGRGKIQVSVIASLTEFSGNIASRYQDATGISEYSYKRDINVDDSLSFRLRFYISCDVVRSGKLETNFKIDSISMVEPSGKTIIPIWKNTRGYLEPYFQFGSNNFKFVTDDQRFDNADIKQDNYINTGLKLSLFFNDSRYSRWDVGMATGIGYKRIRSNVLLESYRDTLRMTEGFTAQQIGDYDLYVAANNIDQTFSYNFIEIPLLFDARYYINKKRTYGFYGEIGGSFNYNFASDYKLNDGTVEYKGHKEVLLNGEYVNYYFDSNLPYYGFDTYEAKEYSKNNLALADYYISGKVHAGFFGLNKNRKIGWQIGAFMDMGLTNVFGPDFSSYNSITTEQGYIKNLNGVNEDLYLFNWGIDFKLIIRIFKERINYIESSNKIQSEIN
jgi:hypothetical protein